MGKRENRAQKEDRIFRLILIIVTYFTLSYLLKFSEFTLTRLNNANENRRHAFLLSFTKKPCSEKIKGQFRVEFCLEEGKSFTLYLSRQLHSNLTFSVLGLSILNH